MWSLIYLVSAESGRKKSMAARGCVGILLILAMLMPTGRVHAVALTSCNVPTVTLTIQPTANILVPNQVGSVVYTGEVALTRTCKTPSVISASNTLSLGSNIGSSSALASSTVWLGIRTTSQSSSISGVNCFRNVTSTIFNSTQTYQVMNFVGSSANTTCTITYKYTVEIYVIQPAAAAVVAFPYVDPTVLPSSGSTIGWVIWFDSLIPTGYALPAIGVNFVAVGCTVSTSNVVVNLPATSTTALNAAGQTAQLQAFNIGLTGCSGLGSTYSASANWSFTPLGANASVINNSAASGAAGNVGIQLLDGSLNPITSNGKSTLVSIPASGSYSSTVYARYYAVGAATAGAVQGIATFTVTFQ